MTSSPMKVVYGCFASMFHRLPLAFLMVSNTSDASVDHSIVANLL